MNKNIMKKWVKALRSGKYRKTTGDLCKVAQNGNKSYCCLGVLTDLYNKENKRCPVETVGEKDLSHWVMDWSGMHSSFGSLKYGYSDKTITSLSELNDCNKAKRSFKRMADIIEKNWEQL
jgi:hypothetical protein